jgi:1-acyl-sn-glycerol-3-phosphate acyltransferase
MAENSRSVMSILNRYFAQPSIIRLAKALWPQVLSLRDGVDGVNVVGNGLQRFADLRGTRTIICPNHPSEADGDVIFMLSRIVSEDFHFVAASELFATYRELYGVFMTLGGCFAVRRASADPASYKAIRDDLVQGSTKLVIFPEGELSHDFTDLLPLENGAAQIGFWVLEELQKQHDDHSVKILPIAIAYAYSSDPSTVFDASLRRLESNLGIRTDSDAPLQDRLHAALQKLVESIEEAYGCTPKQGKSLDDRITTLRHIIVQRMASALAIDEAEKNEVVLAHKFHEALERAENTPREETAYANRLRKERRASAAILARDLKRMMNLRLSLRKCSGAYLYQEIGEVLYMLGHEVFGKPLRMPRRNALLAVGEPIDVSAWLDQYKEHRHQAIEALNRELGGRLRELQRTLIPEVERLNTALQFPAKIARSGT